MHKSKHKIRFFCNKSKHKIKESHHPPLYRRKILRLNDKLPNGVAIQTPKAQKHRNGAAIQTAKPLKQRSHSNSEARNGASH